jgi:hypothetical protein
MWARHHRAVARRAIASDSAMMATRHNGAIRVTLQSVTRKVHIHSLKKPYVSFGDVFFKQAVRTDEWICYPLLEGTAHSRSVGRKQRRPVEWLRSSRPSLAPHSRPSAPPDRPFAVCQRYGWYPVFSHTGGRGSTPGVKCNSAMLIRC